MTGEKPVKSFLTLFPRLKPALLHKDVGAIPYYLAANHGWRSSMVFFAESSNFWPEGVDDKFARAVTLVNLGKRGSQIWNAIRIICFIVLKGRKFDVVNYYHDSVKNMLYGLMYKFCNPLGKVYCKLDMSHLELEHIAENRHKPLSSLTRRLKYLLSKMAVDVYSAETSAVYRELSSDNYYAGRLHYISNGIACPEETDITQVLSGKEKIILTVGSLGATAKNNELLVDAIALIDPALISGWKVYLVGPLVNPDFYENGFRESDHFEKYVARVVENHPHLAETFVFTGTISDRTRLNDIYGKAKIFCLTSRYESFGFVVPEAMFYGAYVIASDLPPVRDLTDNGRLGALFPAGDVHELAGLLTAMLEGKVELAQQAKEAHAFIRDKFNWRSIVRDIDMLLS